MPADIAVVIPTFRRPATLPDALRSVLGQRDVGLEVLVVDDDPEGSAETVVRGFDDPRVRYVRNPRPSGGYPGAVRNFGWPLTSAPVLHFMDDDDLLPEGLYAAALAAFATPPRVGVVYGHAEPFGESQDAVERDRELFLSSARRSIRLDWLGGAHWAYATCLLFKGLLYMGGASLIRRECLEAIGGYSGDMRVFEDVDLHSRVTRRFGARYLQRASLLYRVSASSQMHSVSGELQAALEQAYARMYANYRRMYGDLDFYALKIAARTLLRSL